ncbi:MAG: L-threonylcarbamoyladenylate synthase [Pyrinomonadaceae bacterium MAG19_C2-C3]|nr:L-threonylcarbamoyladenylate synthase [Pyrinomonadaceae bacterium MAG19_C2-C3]
MTLIRLPGEDTNALARDFIAKGEIVAFRTDTLYGLGVNPWNRKALRALNKLKRREEGKPTLILISDESSVTDFILNRTPLYELLSQTYFPGAITIIETARDEVPAELTANTKTIGVRVPDDEAVRDFVRACGGALTATSANLSGQPSSLTSHQVAAYFPEGVSLIIDNGRCETTLASTIVDISSQTPHLIREGIVTRESLQTTLSRVRMTLR